MTLSNVKKNHLIGLALLLLFLAIMGYISYKGTAPSLKTPPLKSLTVYKLKKELFAEEISTVGTAKAKDSVVLSANVTENIKEIYFTDGQKVKKGDIIIELSSGEESASLKAAQEIEKEKKQQFERSQALFQKKIVAEAKLEQDTSDFKEAQANVEKAKATLADRLIIAPFDGVLGLKNVSVGALVTPGTPIVNLEDIDEIKIDFDLSEKFIGQVKEKQTITAYSEAYPNEKFKAKILSLDSQIDPVTRTFKARAVIKNEDHRLKAGMFLLITLIAEKKETLFIPEISTLAEGDEKYAFKVSKGNILEKIKIGIGYRLKGKIVVLKGLKENDLIVYEGIKLCRPGEKIEIKAVKGAQ